MFYVLFLRYRHIGSLPSHDATLQINALVADICQSSGSIGRTATTAAIDGYSLVCRQSGLCFLHEVILSLVYQDSTLNMPFGKFSGSPHIKHHDIRICNQFSKSLHIRILKILLATSRIQPQHSQ